MFGCAVQFIHASKPAREEVAAEVYEDEVDLRRSALCLSNSFRSAWSEHSMDPDDFRVKSLLPFNSNQFNLGHNFQYL